MSEKDERKVFMDLNCSPRRQGGVDKVVSAHERSLGIFWKMLSSGWVARKWMGCSGVDGLLGSGWVAREWMGCSGVDGLLGSGWVAREWMGC